MKAWGILTARLSTLIFLGLTACAPVQTMNPEFRAQTLSALRSGTINLNCGAACAWGWVNERARMRAFDAAGDWESLALRVAQVGYQKDLAYYYLGRAAEGLGYREAALAYYGDSYTLATGTQPGPQCRQVAGDCMGVDLLAVLPVKLKLAAAVAGGASTTSPSEKQSDVSVKSRQPSQNNKISIDCKNNQKVLVNNFFPKGDTSSGRAELAANNGKMWISYGPGVEIHTNREYRLFWILVGGRNLKEVQQNQKDAESYLLRTLGIDKETACKLEVQISAPKSMTGRFAYTIEDAFSFCPGAQSIEHMKL